MGDRDRVWGNRKGLWGIGSAISNSQVLGNSEIAISHDPIEKAIYSAFCDLERKLVEAELFMDDVIEFSHSVTVMDVADDKKLINCSIVAIIPSAHIKR